MNPRELVILLLGLAIVAVVLRGLYVAIQARRGQIRLAIDKNIPKDVDLDALEMAELPSGGARVVKRGSESERNAAQQAASAAVSRANSRAAELDLGEDSAESVPVLMDAVQLGAEKPVADTRRVLIDDFDNDYYQDQEEGEEDEEDWDDSPEQIPIANNTDYLDDEYDSEEESFASDTGRQEVGESSEDISDTDPDDVLLDYETEELAAVAPDYDEPEEESVEERDGAPILDCVENAYDSYAADEEEIDSTYDDEVYDEDDFEDGDEDYDGESGQSDAEDYDEVDELDDVEDYADEDDRDLDDRPEPSLGNFEEDLDDFSMTAGERIGYEGKKRPESAPRKTSATQSTLFDSDDEAESMAASSNKGGKRRSLFAALSSWGKSVKRSTADVVDEDTTGADARREDQEIRPRAAEPAMDAAETDSNHEAQTVYRMEPQQLDIEPEENDADDPDLTAVADAADEAPMNSEPSEVLVLNVMAKDGYAFAGDDLMHTLITSGLKFGDMNIFHQRLGNQPKGPVIFSVANILNPGTFDLNSMDTFTTVGISLFLALPSPINNLDAFEKMLTLAQQLCAALGGELRDDSRNLMTAQTIEHYRQRVRDFELRKLKAAGSRG